MDRHKYSAPANSDVITFLVNNGICFTFCKGFQSRRYKVFFMASEEDVKTMTQCTGWYVNDEDDGWEFDEWNSIERK